MQDLRQEAKAGSVIVKEGQRDQQRPDQSRSERCQGPEADFGIELLFELARPCFVQLQRRGLAGCVVAHVGNPWPCF